MNEVIYVAHKMGDNPEANAQRVKSILKYFMAQEPQKTFIAPFLTSFELLDDSNSKERSKGLQDSLNVIKFCNEIWICSEVSEGIKREIETAASYTVKIQFKDTELKDAGL